MDQNLDHIMEEIMNSSETSGCVFANQHGLCLGSKGQVPSNCSGISVAIAEEALKLEPGSKPPVIHFESDNRSCTIQQIGNVTGVIIKNLHN